MLAEMSKKFAMCENLYDSLQNLKFTKLHVLFNDSPAKDFIQHKTCVLLMFLANRTIQTWSQMDGSIDLLGASINKSGSRNRIYSLTNRPMAIWIIANKTMEQQEQTESKSISKSKSKSTCRTRIWTEIHWPGLNRWHSFLFSLFFFFLPLSEVGQPSFFFAPRSFFFLFLFQRHRREIKFSIGGTLQWLKMKHRPPELWTCARQFATIRRMLPRPLPAFATNALNIGLRPGAIQEKLKCFASI